MVNNNTTFSIGKIRIIGGFWRGRKLPVLNRPGLRPTTDRMRETLFNWLASIIKGANCLDCFAGSGALGLEALSRGAATATLLELDGIVSNQLIKNQQILNAHQAHIIKTDSLYWLQYSGTIFDIVFIDPPFQRGLITIIVALLEKNQHLANNAWIYIESKKRDSTIKVPDYWKLHRKKITKKVTYQLYIRNAVINKQNNYSELKSSIESKIYN